MFFSLSYFHARTHTGPRLVPTGLRVRSKRTSATVYWKPLQRCAANADIIGYDIFLENCIRGSLTTIHVMGARTRSYMLHRLMPATEYRLKIAAVNSEGSGPYSLPMVFTTEEV